MIINSNRKYTLLKDGGFKLFSHKLLNSTKLPEISPNYKKKCKLHNIKPYINSFKKIPAKSLIRNSYKHYNFINDTENLENLSIERKHNKIEKPKSKAISRNQEEDIKDIFLDDKTIKINDVDNKNITLMTFETDKNSNLNAFNNLFNDYKKRISYNDLDLIDDNLTHSSSSIDTILKDKEYIKKKKEIKKHILKVNEKKKIAFMKKVLKNDKNFLIDDYLKNRSIQKNKYCSRFFLHSNNNDRASFLNNQLFKQKKDEIPILVKDITIKSLLDRSENKRIKFLKLKPLILNENYLHNKFGKDLNQVSGINKCELKMNLKNKLKFHIKLGNIKNLLNLNHSK